MIIWKLLKNKYIILSESKLCNLTGFISSSRSVRLQFQKKYILKIEYIYIKIHTSCFISEARQRIKWYRICNRCKIHKWTKLQSSF